MNQKNLLNETFQKHLNLLHKRLNLNEKIFKTSGPGVFNNYRGFAFDAIVKSVFKILHPGQSDIVFDSPNLDYAHERLKRKVESETMGIVEGVQTLFNLLKSEYPDFKFECKTEGNDIACYVNDTKIANISKNQDYIEVY
jgi:hypothetical protein